MTLLEMAAELGAARVAWATDFLRYRALHAETDKKAAAMADIDNMERLVMAEARYELAKWRLREDDHDHAPTAAPSPDDEPAEASPDEEGTGQDCGE